MPITGQGLGLRWQKAANSAANAAGRMHRLPCTNAGAMPAVCPVYSPLRMIERASRGSSMRIIGLPAGRVLAYMGCLAVGSRLAYTDAVHEPLTDLGGVAGSDQGT